MSKPGANIDADTVRGFGREWASFDQSKLTGAEYEALFDAYFEIFPFDELPPDAEGFDLGCGSGRWAAGVAPKVGLLHCIDPSEEAIEVARRLLQHRHNVRFHLASSETIPLPDNSQDFGYSLGVLHHIPDTAAALKDCVRKLKPGAPFLVYLYYAFDNRPAWYAAVWRVSDVARPLISRLPFKLRKLVTSVIAATVYWPLARVAAVAEGLGADVSNLPLNAYRRSSFYTMRTDALDRFGTRLEQRFTRDEIKWMMKEAGLERIQFRDELPYWMACGRRALIPSEAAPLPAKTLRVLHVIGDLGLGGAEAVLYRLIANSPTVRHEVVCLAPAGWYSGRLEQLGIHVHHLDLTSLAALPGGALKLRAILRSSRPDVVQCWMYRSNTFAGPLARMAGIPVIWNIRCLEPDVGIGSHMLARVSGVLARWVPDLIINCSTRSAEFHSRLGYSAAEGTVIPNGYNVVALHPDDKARAATRESLGLGADTFVVGNIGRWHPQKNIPGLLEALRIVADRGIDVTCLLVGNRLNPENDELMAAVRTIGGPPVLALGKRNDIEDIARAIDLHVLSSTTEAFPNVVAETMLSGTPNAATDVGDAAAIIGDTGWVVPPRDSQQLADAIEQAWREWNSRPDDWQQRRTAARRRIAETYSLEKMVEAYVGVWRQFAKKVPTSGADR